MSSQGAEEMPSRQMVGSGGLDSFNALGLVVAAKWVEKKRI